MSRSPAALARRLALVVVASAVVIGAVPAPAGAQSAAEGSVADDTAFVVALEADGDATVTLRLTFHLDREVEREALARLRENRSAVAAGFEAGLERVAARTAAGTGREMRIADVAVDVSTAGGTGVVELSATWVGLAAVEEDRLVVSQPFADGFTPPGRFVVRGPEGYAVAASSPDATTTDDGSAAWAAGSSLDGFEAAFVPADAAAGRSQPLPGFGFAAAALALAFVTAIAVLAAHRGD